MYRVKRREISRRTANGKRRRLIQRDQRVCQYCGKKCYGDVPPDDSRYLTIDHIIPTSRGGHKTSEVNQVVCCVLCNRLKADRMPWEIEMWPLNGLGGCWAARRAPG